MIRGALDLTSKQALVGMTPMEKVRKGALGSLYSDVSVWREQHAPCGSLQLGVPPELAMQAKA